jgi:hypothetical protein
MEVTHIGYLWVEEPVSIDVELISYITGLPYRGENPALYLDDKKKEKALAEDMENTYGIERGSCVIIIKHISESKTRLTTKLMACKFPRKCHKE